MWFWLLHLPIARQKAEPNWRSGPTSHSTADLILNRALGSGVFFTCSLGITDRVWKVLVTFYFYVFNECIKVKFGKLFCFTIIFKYLVPFKLSKCLWSSGRFKSRSITDNNVLPMAIRAVWEQVLRIQYLRLGIGVIHTWQECVGMTLSQRLVELCIMFCTGTLGLRACFSCSIF